MVEKYSWDETLDFCDVRDALWDIEKVPIAHGFFNARERFSSVVSQIEMSLSHN
jgi:hypothetical protein